tara:strand:+ start:7302 stop:7709 length:408 start_codon:yes stop_codon:yes gene_type:complete
MKIIDKISKDFMLAYKAKRMEEKDYLGFLKSEVTRDNKTPDDADVVAKLKSMVKKSLDKDGVSCLTETEMEILNRYVPSQMSEEDLTSYLSNYIRDNNIEGMKSMGVLMTFLKEEFPGQYDGKLASTLVRKLLQN